MEQPGPLRTRTAQRWAESIAALDLDKPAEGLDPGRWRDLCRDAEWLIANFGDQAARGGWTAADLFGLWPDKPGWGGIADRLRGSRSLVLTADRAHWRSWGQVERFNRGSYPELLPMWNFAPFPNSSKNAASCSKRTNT